MKNADDLHAVRPGAVEDEVVADGEEPHSGSQFFSRLASAGVGREKRAGAVNLFAQACRRSWVATCDGGHDLEKVVICLRRVCGLGHQALAMSAIRVRSFENTSALLISSPPSA